MRMEGIRALVRSWCAGLAGSTGLRLGFLLLLGLPLAFNSANAQQPTRVMAAIEGSGAHTIAGQSTGAESEISFISVISYATTADDGYAYLIEPQDDGLSYDVSTRDGSGSRLDLAVTAIPLPRDAVTQRSIHSVEAGEDNAVRIPPPPSADFTGIVVVEMLGYKPGNAINYSYSLHIERDQVFIRHGHSDNGQIIFRITRVDWPGTLAPEVHSGCRLLRSTSDGSQRRYSLVDVLGLAITSPTTYWNNGDNLSYSLFISDTPQQHLNNIDLSTSRSGTVEVRLCWIDFRFGIRATDNCRRCEARAISACQDDGGVAAYWFYSGDAESVFTGCRAQCGEGMRLGRPSGTANQCYLAPWNVQ